MSTIPSRPLHTRRRAGFTLPEILIAGVIATMATVATMGTFLFGLRTMYRNGQRLETNASLRYFLGHITTNSMDSTEFLLLPNYTALDGDVDLGTSWPESSLAQPSTDSFGSALAQGDCLVLVKRLTLDPTARIQRVRIYYRGTTDSQIMAPILYFERDFGASGSANSREDILNTISLPTTPTGGVRRLVAQGIGRRDLAGSTYLPIFSAETPSGTTPSFASVALNLEVINGTNTNNMLSSSSFNYVISPRK